MVQLRSGSLNMNSNMEMKGKKQLSPFFISCDWGTSRFRMSLVQGNPVKTVCSISDEDGIKNIHKRWKASGEQNQEYFYTQILRDKLMVLRKKTDNKHDIESLPFVISGMAEAKHLGIHHIPAKPYFKHDIYVVSGLKTKDDVMRGEETLLLGVITKHQIENGIVILPGTHSKHIYITDGIVNDFTTFITGELFDLLSRQSILSETVDMPTNWNDIKGFKDGLNDSKQEALLSELFKIRSASLLHQNIGTYNYFRLSGQLIGFEIKSLVPRNPENIYIAGDSKLLSLYELACEHYNFSYQTIKQSDDLLAAGHLQILSSVINKI